MIPKLLRIKKSIQRTYQFDEPYQAREFADLMEGFELVHMSSDGKTIILEEVFYDEYNKEGVNDHEEK